MFICQHSSFYVQKALKKNRPVKEQEYELRRYERSDSIRKYMNEQVN